MSASGENKPCLIGKNTNSQLSEEQDQVHLRLRRRRGRKKEEGKEQTDLSIMNVMLHLYRGHTRRKLL